MPARTTFKVVALCALLLSLVASVVGVQTQRRRRPSRRATNPVSPTYVPAPRLTPSVGDPRLVSSAEDERQQEEEEERRSSSGNARRGAARQGADPEASRAVKQLSNEITQLNKKVSEMEKQRRTDLLQERLTRAEQRVESLQTQMSEVAEKQANLQARVEQLDEAMKPETLDRQVATIGTFRPNEARDSLRRQLDNEKRRVQSQLDVQSARRQQLERSLGDAQQLADRMRADLAAALRQETEGGGGGTGTTAAPPPNSSPPPGETPTPTPTPPQL